jgi:S-adenosylmethionine hydrolase
LSVITFLSDFGADSHYLASFKGALLKIGTPLSFIEITSRIEPFDIQEAAYLSALVYKDFPKNSIHILATDVVSTSFNGHVAAFFDGHFFIGPNNGVLSLIFPDDFENYYLIKTTSYEQKIQNVYVPFIKELTQADFNLDRIAQKTDTILKKTSIQPIKNEKELRGHVIFVDHFGNAYTNISYTDFHSFVQNNEYTIHLSYNETVKSVKNNFSDVQDGDPICYFSDNGMIVVAVKKGNAERLLNLRKSKTITINKK